MFKKLIKKLISEELAAASGKSNQARLADLEKENAALKAQIESSGPTKRLQKLKEMVAKIPEHAQGMGMIAVLEDGVMKNITLTSRQDLTDLVGRAEKGEIEVLLS